MPRADHRAVVDAELTRFFAHWVPLLRGERSAAEVQSALGKSRSPATNLGFYRTLMERNVTGILSALFPDTRAAFIAWARGHWLPTALHYDREHPAASCNPNEFGRQFPDFVSRARALDPSLPALLEELADYEWLQYALGAGVRVEQNAALPADSYALRQYDHDLPRLVSALRAGKKLPLPVPRSITVLLYRDRETGHPRVLYPSRAALLALARRAGLSARDTVDREPDFAVDEAERALAALGVFS